MATHNDVGKWGEEYATQYLKGKDYLILDRDWRPGKGLVDLDIVCLTPDRRTVAFVEVKTHSKQEITDPEEAVDIRKMRHLGRAADTYVKIRDIVEELRFDIITIIGEENDPHPQLEHIQDAFNPLLI